MPALSSPLATHLAPLRSIAPAMDGRGMLSISLHALIAAIFARIFDRLEQLFQLWQSGTLPLPPLRQPPLSQPPLRESARRRPESRRPRRRPARLRARRVTSRAIAVIHPPAGTATPRPHAPSPPPRRAHDPPRTPEKPAVPP